MPAAGGAQTLVASAQGRARPALRTRRQRPRVLPHQPRPRLDHARRLRPPHGRARAGRGPGQQPAGRRRDPALAGWHEGVREPAGPPSPVLVAARRPRHGGSAHHRPRRQHGSARYADLGRGRRLSGLDERRRLGGVGPRRAGVPADRRQRRTAAPRRGGGSATRQAHGLRAAHRRTRHHHERRRGARERRHPRDRQPHCRRGSARQGDRRARHPPHRSARQDGHPGHRGRARAHVGAARPAPDGRCGSTTRTSPTA
jgi:hypothetical protein